MDKLFVIIVTYNGEQWIEKCLISIKESSIPAIPIIIDNGSTDCTLEIIKKKFKDYQVIITGQNLGFGKANNIGIHSAIKQGAEYIYLLNQDAWVEKETFETLIRIHKNNTGFGIVSPVQCNGSGTDLDRNFYARLKEIPFFSNFNKNESTNDDIIIEVPFVMAAHWLLYVPDIKKIGLFSPVFPHYGEDNNLIDRYKYFGLKIGVCPCAIAYHDRQYREEPPGKLLYIHFTSFLACINNPAGTPLYRLSRFLHFAARCLKMKEISMPERIKTIKQGIIKIKESIKYRKLYRKEGMCMFITD